MKFDHWLDIFVDEKEIDLEEIITVDGANGANFIPVTCLIQAIKNTCDREKESIQSTLVRIDFVNGDVMHFFRHLAKAIAI